MRRQDQAQGSKPARNSLPGLSPFPSCSLNGNHSSPRCQALANFLTKASVWFLAGPQASDSMTLLVCSDPGRTAYRLCFLPQLPNLARPILYPRLFIKTNHSKTQTLRNPPNKEHDQNPNETLPFQRKPRTSFSPNTAGGEANFLSSRKW